MSYWISALLLVVVLIAAIWNVRKVGAPKDKDRTDAQKDDDRWDRQW